MEFPEYQGMSYEQASREGSRLIAEAYAIQHWFHLPERLSCLRGIMVLQTISGPTKDQECLAPPAVH